MTLANHPDGRNINDRVGSTHPQLVQACMRDGGFDIGFAFDGDGDRVVAVDRTGRLADGDELIALAAVHLKAPGRLSGDGVAMTVMTNFGFHRAMRDAGIAVGDDEGRRPLRPRGPARAGLHARRRAVRPHHRARLRPLGRRDRLRAADPRGARRARPRDRARVRPAAPAAHQRPVRGAATVVATAPAVREAVSQAAGTAGRQRARPGAVRAGPSRSCA